MVGNKQVSWKICSEVMGSGNLSRHMKIPVNPSLKDSKQLCKDIKSSKDETSMYSEKPKDPHSDGLDESPLSGDEIDDKELKKRSVTINYSQDGL